MRLTSFACLLLAPALAAGESTHRLQDGITAHIHNPDARTFTVSLTVRDLNLYENGPREVLCKVYDPDGKVLVREVIPDDGVASKSFLPPMGAWDHEAWYYAYIYMKGTQPMIRWSAFSDPARLKSVAARTFNYTIKATKPGTYRVLLAGCIDHYVTLKIDPDLPYGVNGHPDWLVGHGDLYKKQYLYVPKSAVGMYVLLAEYDAPRNRSIRISTLDGKTLLNGSSENLYYQGDLDFTKEGIAEEQVLMVEMSSGAGDYLLGLKFKFERDPDVFHRGIRSNPAVLAATPELAKKLQGGAIYHDGKLFWHGFQTRLYDWLKKQTPADFEVKGPKGEPLNAVPRPLAKSANPPLPTAPNFISLNGPHYRPPDSDIIMHNYPAHKNRQALNLAIKDVIFGLRGIGPNDHIGAAVGGPFCNLAYEFSNYSWQFWRPAWRILKLSDAPDDIKALLHEAFLVAGDRLAFCRTWERVNGNSFALIPTALRYCCEATGDPLQRKLFDVYWDRFENGGWGERVGVGPSGPVQEGFAYAYHYASYMLTSWQSILADLPDERFQRVHDRARMWFAYTLGAENVPTGPWSSRTHYYPQWTIEKSGPFAWKGLPGPDFTDNVNGGNEFFAARRKNYYALTYHGRLSPKWESNAHAGQSGYGGGMLCQLVVPDKGLVLASTLNGSYGEKMDPSLWRTFHLHTLVGRTHDDRPVVSGDSEHEDVVFKDNKVTSSGEVRDIPIKVRRSYTFEPDGIRCGVQLSETGYNNLLSLYVKNPDRGKMAEAYEMIPFVAKAKVVAGKKGGPQATKVELHAAGKALGELGKDARTADKIVIDRGGFGVAIELDQPRPVLSGENATVLIRLIDSPTAASKIGLQYRLVPFGN
jgi:hypothetical protein